MEKKKTRKVQVGQTMKHLPVENTMATTIKGGRITNVRANANQLPFSSLLPNSIVR